MSKRLGVFFLLVAVLSISTPPSTAATYEVKVTRSAYGIPHIVASDYGSLGYGYGYSIASDNLCVLADTYKTVRAERSKYFGPTNSISSRGNGSTATNLNSDFFYQRIIDRGIVESLMSRRPPHGPAPELKDGMKGYVAGYNRYISENPTAAGTQCEGAAWVQPINEIDAWRRLYQLILLASQGVAIDGIATAAPAAPLPNPLNSAQQTEMIQKLGENLPLGAIGSNAYGLGNNALQEGLNGGLLLGNPHFPWEGPERFYQAHLTIPGSPQNPGLNVAGASLFGVPLILIGHTQGLAWSHTVSTAYRFTPFELKLVPGDQTSYLYDGVPRKMRADSVTVDAGSFGTFDRTLYSSRQGSILTSILGTPLFPWTPATAYAMGDVNENNFRILNHFFEVNKAQSVGQLKGILDNVQGIPWVNTIAADSNGDALYADIGAIPNVSDAKIQACPTALGQATFPLLGLPVLDGSTSKCAWDNDPDAAARGILGPSNLPSLMSRDYVTNSNDSYWLANPDHPLEGFARIIGPERTPRTLRTRLGLKMVEERLNASDGMDATPGYTLDLLTDTVFNNRQYAAELWNDELVNMCDESPFAVTQKGFVDLTEACDVLRDFNKTDDLDSAGAILFRRFAARALGGAGGTAGASVPGVVAPSPYTEPFDSENAVNTPSGLDTTNPFIRTSLGLAVQDMQGAGLALDATLRSNQIKNLGASEIPMHGGPGAVGVFNAINVGWNSSTGYRNPNHGSSFVIAAHLDGTACPDVRTILTYSQSTNPQSPHYSDQTQLYSNKVWVSPPFCKQDVDNQAVSTITLTG